MLLALIFHLYLKEFQVIWTNDQGKIKADPSGVAHITVEILDKEGNFVPTLLLTILVEFKIDGAKLIGVESGNMRDLSSPKENKRKAFNGLCLAIIQAKGAGKIKVEAISEGLSGDYIEINVNYN